jgi:hypothetical protein
MKKVISAVLLVALLACSVFALASCGISGTYKNDLYTLDFSGDEVEIQAKSGALSLNYTASYELGENEDGEQTITFTYAEGADKSLVFNGTMKYNEGEDNDGKYIELGAIKLYKD